MALVSSGNLCESSATLQHQVAVVDGHRLGMRVFS